MLSKERKQTFLVRAKIVMKEKRIGVKKTMAQEKQVPHFHFQTKQTQIEVHR
jgi:hypothetical protein